jgi:hypothetical protein
MATLRGQQLLAELAARAEMARGDSPYYADERVVGWLGHEVSSPHRSSDGWSAARIHSAATRLRARVEAARLKVRLVAGAPPVVRAAAPGMIADVLDVARAMRAAPRLDLGAAAYRRAMIASGIPAEAIEEVPMEPTEILHTLIESRMVVRFAKARGHERLVVVSAPFHQERAFMTMVTAALQEHPSLKVYSAPGAPQPWDEIVTHSQGKLRGTRAELIAEEQKRIAKYTALGDLLPRARIIEYLRKRD